MGGRPRTVAQAVAVGLVMVLATAGRAAVLNFEDVAVAPGANDIGGDRVSGGFTFDSASNHTHLANDAFSASNGTTYLVFDDFEGEATMTVSPVGGGVFAIGSIDLAEWPDGSETAKTVDVTGNLFGGGTVNTTFTLDLVANGVGAPADFETFAFGPAWINLTSIVLKGAGSVTGNDYVAMDNLVLEPVPEPATVSLLGLGVLVLARRRRR